MTKFIADPEIQVEIDRVTVKLRAMSVGATMAYTELHDDRYIIDRAREAVEKEDGIRFGTVRNVGVKRLAADDVPSIGASGTKRLHKAAKRTVRRLSNLKAYNDMQPADRLRIAAHRLVASAVVEKTARTAVKEMEDNVRTAGAAIDFGTVLQRG